MFAERPVLSVVEGSRSKEINLKSQIINIFSSQMPILCTIQKQEYLSDYNVTGGGLLNSETIKYIIRKNAKTNDMNHTY